MMEAEHTSPWTWIQGWALNMGWPVIVLAGFWLGRYVQKLEMRVDKADKRLEALLERHMPAIHRALAEIRGLIVGGR